MKRSVALLMSIMVLSITATALATAPTETDDVVCFGHRVQVTPGETVTGEVVFLWEHRHPHPLWHTCSGCLV